MVKWSCLYKESVHDLSHFCRQPPPKDLMFCFSLAAKRCCVALLFSNLEKQHTNRHTVWWRLLLYKLKTLFSVGGGSLCQMPSSWTFCFCTAVKKNNNQETVTLALLLTLNIICQVERKFCLRRCSKDNEITTHHENCFSCVFLPGSVYVPVKALQLVFGPSSAGPWLQMAACVSPRQNPYHLLHPTGSDQISQEQRRIEMHSMFSDVPADKF